MAPFNKQQTDLSKISYHQNNVVSSILQREVNFIRHKSLVEPQTAVQSGEKIGLRAQNNIVCNKMLSAGISFVSE